MKEDCLKLLNETPTVIELFALLSGRLFARSLVINARDRFPFPAKLPHILVSVFLNALPIMINLYFQIYGESKYETFFYLEHKEYPPSEGYKNWEYWFFCVCTCYINYTIGVPNMYFLTAACVEAFRLRYKLTQLTYCIEFNVFKKNYGSLINPLFNFMDPNSLLTWLDMRNLIKDVGYKFHIRIYIYGTAFAIFVGVNVSFLVLYFYGYPIMYLPTHTDFFLSQILIVIVMTIVLACQLVPLSYINEETERQIAIFNEIRHFLHRMISD